MPVRTALNVSHSGKLMDCSNSLPRSRYNGYDTESNMLP